MAGRGWVSFRKKPQESMRIKQHSHSIYSLKSSRCSSSSTKMGGFPLALPGLRGCQDDYKLLLVFTKGEHRIHDYSPLLDFGVFQKLRGKNYFQQVAVVDGTVAWPHEQDICPDTLYRDSQREVADAVSGQEHP